jgi:hypothetical protein
MHVLLTGGTGLIGSQLSRYWLSQGHRVSVWSREPARVPQRCGEGARGIASLDALGDETVDAVINLAGAPIAQRPWTRHRRELLWASRIGLTEQLLAWMERQPQRPGVLISGSAVGWYGNGGEHPLNEQSLPVSEDFASRLCMAWEETALRAEALGMRVVLVRTGLVLSAEGGMLTQLLRPFKLGLGGPIGSGRQWMPWVHIKDQIALIDFLLNCHTASGPYNACAPHPVRNQEFARQLGKALHRPAVLPVPAFVLRTALGEMSGLLLGGQRAQPARLEAAGFNFAFSDLQGALDDLVRRP